MLLHKLTKLIVFLLLILMSWNCSPTKSALKRGAVLEASNNFKEASELYYLTALKKPLDVQLKTALQRSGQLYMDEMNSKTAQNFAKGDYKKVVYDYQEIERFTKRTTSVGVELSADYNLQRTYENALDNYLNNEYEKGQRLMAEQKFDEAKRSFLEIHKFNQNYRDTEIYLNEATNEPLYIQGSELFGQKRYIEAYQTWAKVAAKDANYKDVKTLMDQAIAERYKEGSLWLMEEKFNEAAVALGDVVKINPIYSDAKPLLVEAINEPIYRNGNANLTAGKCRTAYYNFTDVINNAQTYKNTIELKDMALACAQYPIVLEFVNANRKGGDTLRFENLLADKIVNSNSPFVKLVQQPVKGKTYQQGNQLNNPQRVQAVQLNLKNQPKAILSIQLNEYSKSLTPLKKTTKVGFIRTETKNQAGEKVTNYTKVNYTEYSQQTGVKFVLTYQLISTQTKQILISKRVEDVKSDQMYYAAYGDNFKNLYPSKNANGTEVVDPNNYQNLQNLLQAKKQITPLPTLVNQLFEGVANTITQTVINFNPEQ